MKHGAGVAAETDGSAKPSGATAAPDHFAGRRFMLRALSEELVGPSPMGPEIDPEAVAKGGFPRTSSLTALTSKRAPKRRSFASSRPGSAMASAYSTPEGLQRSPTAQTTASRTERSKRPRLFLRRRRAQRRENR